MKNDDPAFATFRWRRRRERGTTIGLTAPPEMPGRGFSPEARELKADDAE
jgi:hypothetical protein